jgi:hypothetical protein
MTHTQGAFVERWSLCLKNAPKSKTSVSPTKETLEIGRKENPTQGSLQSQTRIERHKSSFFEFRRLKLLEDSGILHLSAQSKVIPQFFNSSHKQSP